MTRYLKSLIVDYELPIPRKAQDQEARWVQDIGGLLGARWPAETWCLWRYIGEDGGAVHVGAYVKYQRRHMIYPGTLRVRGALPQLWATKDIGDYVKLTRGGRGWGVLGYTSNLPGAIGGRGARRKYLRGLILHGNQGRRIPRHLPTRVEPPTIDPAGMTQAWGEIRGRQARGGPREGRPSPTPGVPRGRPGSNPVTELPVLSRSNLPVLLGCLVGIGAGLWDVLSKRGSP